MGKGNRERRRAKQKKAREQQRRRNAQGPDQRFQDVSYQEKARDLIDQVLAPCYCAQCEPLLWDPVALLAEPAPPAWRRVVDRVLFTDLEEAVGHLWKRGWQPTEFVRELRREAGKKAESLGADMVIAENRRHAPARVVEEWAAQVRGLGEPWWGTDIDHAALFAERHGLDRKGYVDTALRVLELLVSLPELQIFLPLPGTAQAVSSTAASRADPAKLAKIRNLLAKAEVTEFPEEAEALSGRAQQMMARHSIDHAALEADTGTASHIHGRRLPVESPYEQHKVTLLNVVAQANNCRSVWHKHMGLCTVMGFPDEVNMVELLFTSLLVQATRAMQRAGSMRDAGGRSRTRSFRSSFLSSFAERIGERLHESAHAEEEAAVQEYAQEGRDLLPVLASRVREVEDAVAEAFPELTYASMGGGATNWQGWSAGRAAADDAALGAGERLEAG